MFNDLERGWLAGLLEGEGCFLSGPPSSPNSPRIVVAMTDRDVLERYSGICGSGGVISETPKPRRKQSWRVTVFGPKAVAVAQEIRPLMGERRQRQIDKMIGDHYGSPSS